MTPRLILLLLLLPLSYADEVYDIRIHEGAEKATRLTMGVALQRRTESMKGCYGQLESDVEWIEYRSSRNAFYTTAAVGEQRNGDQLTGTLHLLCAGNRMHSLDFRVHVSHRNHHPPTFSQMEYAFYVPVTLPKDAVVAKLEVSDNDPVIYNSERQLSFTEEQPLFSIQSDGTIKLKQTIEHEIPYKTLRMQVLAIDYGSPQLYTLANLSITPVTVSAVRELRVNVATEEYQVVEWEIPEYGHAERFRLTIRKGDVIVHEEEVDGRKQRVLTKVPINPVGNFSYIVTSSDVSGETPSDVKRFHVFQNDLVCAGECSTGGGVPLCYYGPFNRVEQFVDRLGAHCQCFPGHTGVSCDVIASCQSEKTVDSHGGLDWPDTNTNITLRVQCPYNMARENQWIERSCLWEKNLQRAVWGRPREDDKCKVQASVLTHLAMLGTFAANANSVSTIHTVARFVRDLLAVPAFSSNTSSSAHFDQKIAENVADVVDTLLVMDIEALQGNTSIAKADLLSAINELSSRLPIPFSLSSPHHGLQMKSLRWTKQPDTIDNALGTRCRVNLPKVEPEQTLRAVCMTNATLVDIIEQTNPLLSLHTDSEEPKQFSKMLILLKPKDDLENYTCVYYDETEGGWSTRGIRRLDVNYHGFVRCETNHLGLFSLLPDRLFVSSSDSLRDLSVLLPVASTVIALVCSLFLLGLAAVQKGPSIDFALLFFLFFVFMLHIAHLAMLVAPQVGDPYPSSPSLHILLQFSLLSLSASLYLVLSSLHDVIESRDKSKEDEDPECCSARCSVFFLSVVLPALLTFLTYHYADDYDNRLAKLVERVDWLFLGAYLGPVVLFFSLVFAYSVWNIYLGKTARSRHRGSTDRFEALTPAVHASLASIVMVFLLVCCVVLFVFRSSSVVCALSLSLSQLLYSSAAFIFAACVFRARAGSQRESAGGSCHSLERKRDISRALLDHVDAPRSDGGSPQQEMYLTMHHNLYDRQPMVSIV